MERKLREAKEAKQPERKGGEGSFYKSKSFREDWRIKTKTPCWISIKAALEEIAQSRTYKNSLMHNIHSSFLRPSCCLPRFPITLFISYHAPTNIVPHCFTSHYLNLMSAASPGDSFCTFSNPLTSLSWKSVFLNQFVPQHAIMAHSTGQ